MSFLDELVGGAPGEPGPPGRSGGDSFAYTFDTSTVAAFPGSGKARLNASPDVATEAYIANTNADGVDVSAWLEAMGVGAGATKGRLKIGSAADPTKFAIFDITAVTADSGFHTLSLTPVDANGAIPVVAGDLLVGFALAGAKGDQGDDGAPFVDLVAAPDLTDADQTLAVADGGRFIQQAGSTTAGRTKALSITGARDKQLIQIFNLASHSLTIKTGSLAGTTLTTLAPGTGSDFGYDSATSSWINGNNANIALTPGTPGPTGPTGPAGPPGSGINLRSPRTSVRGASTGNLNIASPVSTTQDGIVYTANQSILLKSQTTQAENGIYIFGTVSGATASLIRVDGPFSATYATGDGFRVQVREGTVNAGKQFLIDAAKAVSAVADANLTGHSWTEVDLEDFYVPADGTDYSAAFHRAQGAQRCNNAIGTIWARRQSVYNFATPLLVTQGIAFKGAAGTLKNGPQMNFSKSGIWVLGGRADTTDGILAAAGCELEHLTLLGPGATSSNRWPGVFFSSEVFATNVNVQFFPGRGVNGYASTSHDFDSINTTTAANFTVPAVGATVDIQFTSAAGIIAGTVVRIAGAGHYYVDALVSGTTFTCQNIGFAHNTAYAVANATPATVIASGAAVRGVFNNVDLSSWIGGSALQNGLSGFVIGGDNANACYFRGINITSNGLRQVRDDNHGAIDDSQLGNTWVMMHSSGNNEHVPTGITTTADFNLPPESKSSSDLANITITITVDSTTGLTAGDRVAIAGAGTIVVVGVTSSTTIRANFVRHSLADGTLITSGKTLLWPAYGYLCSGHSGSDSLYLGCYAESTDVARIDLPSQIVGGRVGNIGTAGKLTASTASQESSYLIARGFGSYQTSFATPAPGSDQCFRFASDSASGGDAGNGYTVEWSNSRKAYTFRWAGASGWEAMYLTGTGHSNSVGLASFPRGHLFGAHRISSSLLANLPTTSVESGSTDMWNMLAGSNDTMIGRDPLGTAGAGWLYKCTKSGTALTWTPDRLGLKNQTCNLGAAVLTLTAATPVTKTLTGAAVGDNVVWNIRSGEVDGVIYRVKVSAADTIQISAYNTTAGTVDLSATVIDFTLLKI